MRDFAVLAVGLLLIGGIMGLEATRSDPVIPPVTDDLRAGDCTRAKYTNRPPIAWQGVIVCAPIESTNPPTRIELTRLYECLDEHAVEYDPARLTGWRFYEVGDLIIYPAPRGAFPLGYADRAGKRIFVRRQVMHPDWEARKRVTYMHEVIHAVRSVIGHDSVYAECAG